MPARHAPCSIRRIQALGGTTFLNIRDMQQEGRGYSFYHGRPTGTGALFWRFVEYPDKERIEVTKERDVAYIYTGDKGYEVTFKGPHAMEKKDLEDYLRRRRLSLENVLRTWVNDPSVALFYDGNALAGNLAAEQVTLINSKNEAVSLYFDVDSHLPLKKSYRWRDPVDKERNIRRRSLRQLQADSRCNGLLQLHALLQRRHAIPALHKLGSVQSGARRSHVRS